MNGWRSWGGTAGRRIVGDVELGSESMLDDLASQGAMMGIPDLDEVEAWRKVAKVQEGLSGGAGDYRSMQVFAVEIREQESGSGSNGMRKFDDKLILNRVRVDPTPHPGARIPLLKQICTNYPPKYRDNHLYQSL